MPLIIIPPPNISSPNLYDAYNYMMNGDIATGRSTMAQFYKQGLDNPRARLYETMIERRNIREFGKECLNSTNAPTELRRAHRKIVNELFFSQHPLVDNALDQLWESFRNLYPDKKTQRLTRFILGKTATPELRKFKCLIKLMK